MRIERQHETTVINELVGARVKQLLGVGPGGVIGYHIFYMQTDDTWYRFFIDHDVLFWRTTDPAPEDDLADDESYAEILCPAQDGTLELVKEIRMQDGTLTIDFQSNVSLQVARSPENGGMTITTL